MTPVKTEHPQQGTRELTASELQLVGGGALPGLHKSSNVTLKRGIVG